MRKVVLAGGSGFIGGQLTDLLVKLGYPVVVLSRGNNAPRGATLATWDGVHVGPWIEEIEGAHAVINLSGATISQKWTPESKAEILQSRVLSTKAIGMALETVKAKPAVWINGSATGYYGNRKGEALTEDSTPGPKGHFLVDTCVAWEAIVDGFELPEIRKVKLRTGLVLGREGGIFPPFFNLTRMFLGGHHGSGDQFMSWIHVEDMIRLIVHCMESEVTGPINATAPSPCDNRFFMASLRGVVGRPWSPPVPGFMLKIANWFGAPDPSLLLEGQKVLPEKAKETGFRFHFEEVREALIDLVKPQPPK